ncbi:chemotaxis protein CheV [Trichlorobacter sp.]|jgi:two-component system, chemotaxis family, chemotaxis protein CheV|uniref:chemotaxis protein CheV n=1 Tax=Trichlorobacter sp. TaxID=2911007 RepID=UPI0039B8E6C2
MAIKQTNILLESDTNELEIVEFRVDEYDHHGNLVPCHYGVNVAKVREIIRMPEVTKSLNSVDAIEGMIKLREKVITVLNLARILNKDTGDMQADRVIVLEFNNLMVGVLVHSVSRIYRISWKNVEAPSMSAHSDQVTGLVKMDDRIILVLDFEKIVAEFCSSSALKPLAPEQLAEAPTHDRNSKTILVADDSPFIRSTMCSALRGAGYNVLEAVNGAEAWDKIRDLMQRCDTEGVTLRSKLQLLITDVEMPQMDGLHLTSTVRKEKNPQELPIIIFSSLASEDNIRKWESLGAQKILTKPDLPNLVKYADEYTA